MRCCFARLSLLCFFSLLFFTACEEEAMVPKPRAYPRVIYPEKAYQTFTGEGCDFTFEYPVYTEIVKAEKRLDEKEDPTCWFDVFYPQYDGTIYFSYHPLLADTSLDYYKRQTFEMVEWHNKRANYIDEVVIDRPTVKGLAFDIKGPAASPFQFYVTDEKKHFVRGALYFNTQARPDSLAPVTAFVLQDILKIIETINWKEE